MYQLSGESIMKIGWAAATLVVIIALIFYRNDLGEESRTSLSGLFALAWSASSVVYAGGMRIKKQLQQRIKDLESSRS